MTKPNPGTCQTRDMSSYIAASIPDVGALLQAMGMCRDMGCFTVFAHGLCDVGVLLESCCKLMTDVGCLLQALEMCKHMGCCPVSDHGLCDVQTHVDGRLL
jgi:hypothetical protein